MGAPIMGRILSTVTRVLRKRTLRLIADSVFYSGALSLAKLPVRAQARNGPGSRGKFSPFMVLLYHRVNRERDPFFPSVSVTAFEAQMRYLARNFNVLSLNDICQRIGEGREIRPWPVAITFDDGYRDNYLYANPILKKYRLPATIFVPTGYIETGLVLWNDRIAQAIKQTQRKEIALTLNHAGCIFRLQSADDKVKFLNIVLQAL